MFIRAESGDTRKTNLSYFQTYQYKEEYVKSITDQIKDEWKSSGTLSVYWNEMLMTTFEGTAQEEQLAILVSGIVVLRC